MAAFIACKRLICSSVVSPLSSCVFFAFSPVTPLLFRLCRRACIVPFFFLFAVVVRSLPSLLSHTHTKKEKHKMSDASLTSFYLDCRVKSVLLRVPPWPCRHTRSCASVQLKIRKSRKHTPAPGVHQRPIYFLCLYLFSTCTVYDIYYLRTLPIGRPRLHSHNLFSFVQRRLQPTHSSPTFLHTHTQSIIKEEKRGL